MLTRNTDIIRTNNGDYINVNSQNRLIKTMVNSIADNVYSFGIRFGASVDANTAKEMQGTYWASAQADANEYSEDVQIATL